MTDSINNTNTDETTIPIIETYQTTIPIIETYQTTNLTTIPIHIGYLTKYNFLDNDFINNMQKLILFNDVIEYIKTNITIEPKSAKVAISFVCYKLIKNNFITDSNSMVIEINKFLNHILTNFNQYNSSFQMKFTIQHKFIKFSNNYLLENNYEQLY